MANTSSTNKDTIYIDIDEEITGIIDKVRSSSGKIVALVLPKRASVLQSIVNMKLLKRSADEAKKHLVLITSEAGLLPLAGAVGLHVAKTPQSKPEVPVAPAADDGVETIEEADSEDFSPATAASRPVGELAGLGAVATDDEVETLELDDEEADSEDANGVIPPPVAAPKLKKDKKLHVPNFERFRVLLALGALAIILLIVGIIYALKVLPKAEIAINTNASNVNSNLNLILDTAAKSVDPASNVVPAKQVSQQKTLTQSAPATGQKNTGDRATGQAKLINCSSGDPITVPAGTGLTTSSGQTYITQQNATMPVGSKTCKDFPDATSVVVPVKANKAGASFNIDSGTSFSVAPPSDKSYDPVNVKATASGAISGGTDNIVKVISQSDIDAAKQKITAQDASGIKQDLRKQLEQAGLYAVQATYSTGTPVTTNSAEAGSSADTVSVTQVTTYTMFGVKESDLKGLVDTDVKKQIDTTKQSILSEGLDKATFHVNNVSDTNAEVAMQTVATAGPDLNVTDLRQQVAGKKGGDIKTLLQSNPGVTDVQIHLSPFWVTSVPKKTSKITITIAKPAAATKSTNANNP